METNEKNTEQTAKTKFCQECGEKISAKAVVCPKCGCQVQEMTKEAPQIVINNSNQNNNQGGPGVVVVGGRAKNKWVALILWFFLGVVGGHKFYEGKIGTGILYLFTGGLFIIGWVIDFFALLVKPNPYYV